MIVYLNIISTFEAGGKYLNAHSVQKMCVLQMEKEKTIGPEPNHNCLQDSTFPKQNKEICSHESTSL